MPGAKKRALDFTNVKEQGEFNPTHVPEGEYLLKITKVEDKTSKQGNDMWEFTCVMVDRKTAVYPYRCTLNVESLWKVRNLFVACGIQVPKKRLNVDPNKLVGKTFGAVMEDDEYEGKMKSVIQGVFPAHDMTEDETPKARKSKKAEPEEPEEEVEEDVEEEIEDEVDVEDL